MASEIEDREDIFKYERSTYPHCIFPKRKCLSQNKFNVVQP